MLRLSLTFLALLTGLLECGAMPMLPTGELSHALESGASTSMRSNLLGSQVSSHSPHPSPNSPASHAEPSALAQKAPRARPPDGPDFEAALAKLVTTKTKAGTAARRGLLSTLRKEWKTQNPHLDPTEHMPAVLLPLPPGPSPFLNKDPAQVLRHVREYRERDRESARARTQKRILEEGGQIRIAPTKRIEVLDERKAMLLYDKKREKQRRADQKRLRRKKRGATDAMGSNNPGDVGAPSSSTPPLGRRTGRPPTGKFKSLKAALAAEKDGVLTSEHEQDVIQSFQERRVRSREQSRTTRRWNRGEAISISSDRPISPPRGPSPSYEESKQGLLRYAAREERSERPSHPGEEAYFKTLDEFRTKQGMHRPPGRNYWVYSEHGPSGGQTTGSTSTPRDPQSERGSESPRGAPSSSEPQATQSHPERSLDGAGARQSNAARGSEGPIEASLGALSRSPQRPSPSSSAHVEGVPARMSRSPEHRASPSPVHATEVQGEESLELHLGPWGRGETGAESRRPPPAHEGPATLRDQRTGSDWLDLRLAPSTSHQGLPSSPVAPASPDRGEHPHSDSGSDWLHLSLGPSSKRRRPEGSDRQQHQLHQPDNAAEEAQGPSTDLTLGRSRGA